MRPHARLPADCGRLDAKLAYSTAKWLTVHGLALPRLSDQLMTQPDAGAFGSLWSAGAKGRHYQLTGDLDFPVGQ